MPRHVPLLAAALALVALALWWLSGDDPAPAPTPQAPPAAEAPDRAAPRPKPAPRPARAPDTQPTPRPDESTRPAAAPAEHRSEAFGTVRTPKGEPIHGAHVAAIHAGRVLRHTTTDTDGRYDLGSFPDVDAAQKRPLPMGLPAQFRLFAKAPGRATVAEAIRPGGPTDFVLPASTVIVGHFVRADGAPLSAFPVDVRPVPIIAGSPKRIETDSTGGFRVEVGPGEWHIDGHAPGCFHDRTVVAAVAGRETVVTIRLDPTIRVTGRVIDSVTREPVPDAGVVMRYDRVHTDAEGRFAFADVPTRRIDTTSLIGQLSVHADGYAVHTRSPPVAPGGDLDLEIPIDRYASIDGRLVGDDGAAIADAPVVLRSARRGPDATTDGQGRFRIERCPPGAWQLTTQVPGHAPYRSAVFTLAPGETRTTVCSLRAGARLAITVRDEAGEPIWRAGVNAIPLASTGGEPRRGRTRADGVATFDTLAPGADYRIIVEANGYEARTTILRAEAEPSVFDVTLRAGAPLRGRVLGVSAASTGDVRVEARPFATRRDFLLNRPRTAPVAEDGTFAFDRLAPGRWVLSLVTKAKRSLVDAEPTVATAGDDVALRARVYAPLAIEGVVVDAADGSPVTERTLFLTRLDGETRAHDGVGRSRATPDGGFQLRDLAAGTYALAAKTRDGRVTAAPVRVVLRPGDQPAHVRLVVDRLPVATIRGRVTRPGGEPVDRGEHPIEVHAVAQDTAQPLRVHSNTDATGAFAVELPLGRTFRLVARHPEWTGVPAVVTPSGDDAPVELTLRTAGAGLRCTLLDSDGDPLARVRVDVRDAHGSRVTPRQWLGMRAAWRAHRAGESHRAREAILAGTITDDRGRFERAGLEPGDYTLCVAGFRPEPIRVDTGAQSRTIRLRPR